ncbi:Hypothetical predicted protein [Mytilus galloprovincialis]|uniref:C1q domain-containing protein n=1 Tax=Mytilus galloprovincialis TaxID=29158 RepID=A0A8B6G4B1_MYTGA|nr:Hypothetical predicted protein [Mytilus galloprovincialis]
MIGILAKSLGSGSESLLSCSKFHFEEKVLEKVVRLEHKLEVYAEKIKLWEESISTSLNKVTKEKIQTETFVDLMRDAHLQDQTRFNDSLVDVKKQTETFVDSMRDAHIKDQTRFNDFLVEVKKQTETFVDSMRNAHLQDQTRFNDSFLGAVDRFKLQSENVTEFYERQMISLLDTYSSKVQELSEAERKRDSTTKLSLRQEQNRFNKSFDKIVDNFQVRFNKSLQEIALKQQKVALTACATYGTVSGGTVVQFPNIKTNIGITDLSAYKSTGKFVCTVAGLYHISAVIMSNTNDGYFHIEKNNAIMITTFYGKVDNYQTRTRVFVTMLDVGDEITVRTANSQYIYQYSCFTIVKLN